MKVDALWVVEPKKIEVREIDIPEPEYNEVQIRIKACGVCAWDSYLYQGQSSFRPLPYTFGHEGVGIITKVGAGVRDFAAGDKVFTASAVNDMMMQYCNQPIDCIVKIPEEATDYHRWVAEPTVCVVNLLYKTGICPGDRVALIGAGYMGLLALQGLQAEPWGELVVFEPREDQRKLAAEYPNSGIYNPLSPEGEAKIKEIEARGGFEVVIEFSASDSGYDAATRMIKKVAGKLVLGAWYRHAKSFDATLWHLSGLTVLNLAPSANAHFRELIPATAALIRRGVYNPGKYVTHTADYHDAAQIFIKSIDKSDGYIKGLITF
jgi:threonine dehydrogenase-like Zn-dependent dehydrogenase